MADNSAAKDSDPRRQSVTDRAGETESLARLFRFFAATQCRGRCVALAANTPGPAVVRGDAATDTARLLRGLPGDEPVVAFTASLLSYLNAGARTAFAGQLAQAAQNRPVAWVFAEAPGLLATADLALPALKGPLGRRNTAYAIGASLREPGGRRDDALLGLADPYLRWLAPARGAGDDFGWVSDDAA
jgi:hypothetical protein